MLLRIDGRPTHGVGQSISSLISGPEGTLVEIQAERAGALLPPFRVRRGAPGAPADPALYKSQLAADQVRRPPRLARKDGWARLAASSGRSMGLLYPLGSQ